METFTIHVFYRSQHGQASTEIMVEAESYEAACKLVEAMYPQLADPNSKGGIY